MASTFAWTRELVERQGWEFTVFSEPDPMLLSNVRFLAGYRRAWQFDVGLLEGLTGTLTAPKTFEQVERTASAGGTDHARIRTHLLHLLWSGRVRADLGHASSESMLLEAS